MVKTQAFQDQCIVIIIIISNNDLLRSINEQREKGDELMKSIKDALMTRDGMPANEADALIEEARDDLNTRIDNGEMYFDICMEWFGLEEDYLDEILD